MTNAQHDFSPQSWSDEILLSTCIRYGEEARKWRNKFLGLLPEIDRRKLYEKHHCSSIFEFAFKVAGVSKEQVMRILSLHNRFEEMPVLRELLTSGEVSVSKMARVASVATKENEEVIANQVQLLSQAAVETFVRDMRSVESDFVHGENLVVRTHKLEIDHNFELAEDVKNQLAELKNKGIDIDEELRLFLKQREENIQQEKEEIAERERGTAATKHPSRYIPKNIKNILKKEHGTKCSMPTCRKSAQEIHHTQRFALAKTHNPHYLAPLCKTHHAIAHTIDQKVQRIKKSKGRQ